MTENLKNSAMQNGLIVGLFITVKFFLSVLNIPVISSFTILVSIAIVVLLYMFAKRYRDNSNNGTMTFFEAFSYVFRVYFYGAIIGSLVILIYSFVKVDFLSNMLNDTLLIYEKINFKIDDKTYDILTTIFKPTSYALFNLFGSAIVAAFWGIILALFLKKEKSIFEE